MKHLHTSFLSSNNKGRVIVPVMNRNNNDVNWIDAAELAESAGITAEQYSAWLDSMCEMGAVTISDRKTH